jgi:hypothetical protein
LGIVDKITLKEPVLRLTLDGSGNLIDSWVPEGSDSSEPINFPKDGVYINNGLVNWASPWGAGTTGINADILSETTWQSQINMSSARFAQDDVEFDYSFIGNINRISELELDIKGQISLPSARVRGAVSGPMQSDFDLKLKSTLGADTVALTGNMDMDLGELALPAFKMGRGELGVDINAQYSPEDMSIEKIVAEWSFSGDNASLTDLEMRSRLVERTMSYNALSKTPIAMHFGDYFLQNGTGLLKEFSVDGSGTYIHTPSGYTMDFARPLILRADNQMVTLTPGAEPEIIYQADQNKIAIDMDVDWEGRRNLYLTDLNLEGQSDNGLVLSGVNKVTADLSSREEWRRSIAGENIRLAPFNVALDYQNDGLRSTVKLDGGVDYNGLLPGGRANRLRANGKVVVKTSGENFALSFQPDQTIKMAEFVSNTGWRGENISFDLIDGTDVLTRVRGAQPFQTHLKNISADIASPENDRHLATQFEDMYVSSDFQSDPQIWDLDISGINMQSEDFPSPGTRIKSGAGTARVTQYENGGVEFAIESPGTEVSTDNVHVTDLFIEMSGRPDDFSANYKAGAVQLKRGEVPVVPMQGTARLQNGVLSGSAVAPMPKTRNTPINIDFLSQEGVGSAHISIPKVVFTPRGLQPQYLIPVLRGKLAEVSGEASADFDFTFGGGGPVRSKGTTTLKNMDIGTLVGPASGVSAKLTFKSMFPLETDGVQTATLVGFDAGFPLENGSVRFEVVADGIRIDEAIWPVIVDDQGDGQGEGKIFISPMLWRFGNVENQAVVNVENLSLGKILQGVGNGNLSATGQISGRLPATIKGVDVEIQGGVLAIKEGGVIQYRNQGIDTFAKDAKAPFVLGDAFAGSETGFAFKALENFEYKELEALIDGPLDGEMTLRMAFGGKNPDLLAGTAFEFNVSVTGELANIARDSIGAFDTQKHLDAVIDMQREAGEKSEE